MLNLDTHIVIFALSGELKPNEEKLLRSHEWGISSIVIWEITKLWQLKKINLDPADESFRGFLTDIKIWPLSYEVNMKMLELDFKSDPADELIAATSLYYEIPLLTRDEKILKSKIVPLVR